MTDRNYAETKEKLASRAERMVKLIDLKAPPALIFNEKKLIDQAFEAWCSENGLDHTRDWDDTFPRIV